MKLEKGSLMQLPVVVRRNNEDAITFLMREHHVHMQFMDSHCPLCAEPVNMDSVRAVSAHADTCSELFVRFGS
jgi:hypothetical protein